MLLGLALLGGCVMYSDDDSDDSTVESINDLAFYKCITPLSRAMELTDFFDRYLDIADDASESEALATSYFGEYYSLEDLHSDSFSSDYWGDICLGDEDDEYDVTLSSYWTGKTADYTSYVTGDRSYRIVYDSSNNDGTLPDGYEISAEADVTAADDVFTINSLEIAYTETLPGESLSVYICGGLEDEALRVNICSEGNFYAYPVSGTLYYSSTGSLECSFKVVFSGNGFEIIEDGGTVSTMSYK